MSNETPLVVSKELIRDVKALKRKNLTPGQIARELGIRPYMVEAILSGNAVPVESRQAPSRPSYEPTLAQIFDARLQEARQQRARDGRRYADEARARTRSASPKDDEAAIRKSMEFLAKLDPK